MARPAMQRLEHRHDAEHRPHGQRGEAGRGDQRQDGQRPAHAEAADQPRGDEKLRQQHRGLRHGIEQREALHALAEGVGAVEHQVGLREVDHGVGDGQQRDVAADAQQVGRLHHGRRTVPEPAAERRGRGRRRGRCAALADDPVEGAHHADRHGEEGRAEQQQARGQVGRVGRAADRRRGPAAGHRAQRAADADEGEHALALLGMEQVHHVGPEQAGGEQVDDAEPDVIGVGDVPRQGGAGAAADQAAAAGGVHDEQAGEGQQAGDHEAVADGQGAAPVHPADGAAEGQHEGQRHDRGHHEQPAQLVHAARHAHRLAHRPQEEVAAQDAEEQQGGEQAWRQLVAAEVEQSRELVHDSSPRA